MKKLTVLISNWLPLSRFALIAIAVAYAASPKNAWSQTKESEAGVAMKFNIPSQSLVDALTAFGIQSGMQVSVDAALVSGKRSGAASGRLSPNAALALILEPADLSFRISRGKTVFITKPRVVELKSITVTGELLERDLQETQTSVSLVPGVELDRSIDKDLFDLIDRLPNITQEGGGFGFVIRGISTGGPGGGSAQAISVQVDGAAIPFGQSLHTGPVSTWDLEQVEILRGPQSTQQGPNALAGAIIMRSHDPVFKEEYKFRADYGSFDESRIAFAANKALNDQWAFRVSYEDYRSDGDIKNEFSGEDNAQESLETARLKLRYQPSEKLDIILGHNYSDNRQASQGVNQELFPAQRVNPTENLTDGISNITNLRINWELNDTWSLSSESTYHTSNYFLINPPPQAFAGQRSVDDDTFNQEFKFLYEAERLTWASGLFYRRTEKDVDFSTDPIPVSAFFPSFPPGVLAVFGNRRDARNTNIAVFTELEYQLNERWALVAGLRFDDEDQDSVDVNLTTFDPEPFPGANSPGTPVDLISDYDALIPKLGFVYEISDKASVGFTYQQGYRAGGSEIDFDNEENEWDPEFTDNFELSSRSILLEGAINLSANIFYTKYTDMQLRIPIDAENPNPLFTRTQNASSATLQGFEISAEWDVDESLNLFGNVGYANTEFGEFIGLDSSGGLEDFSGNRFQQAAEWTGSLGGTYSFGKGFELSLDGSYNGESYYTFANDPGELNSPYVLYNARIGYQSESFWSVYLYGRNLFDKQYLSRRRVDGFGSAGDSRVIGISFNAEY
ncbi:MAG: TonB-dependent receptor [Verrucomicrobiota bacterium]